MLTLETLEVDYSGSLALRGIDIEIGKKEIVALIGSNGAGKSTALNAISGIVPVAAGKVRFGGEDITGASPRAIVTRGIAQVPEGRRIFSTLSVRDNLLMGAHTRSPAEARESLERVYELFEELRAMPSRLGGALSGGQQQMLAIGRALMTRPELLLLDEPPLGLAPVVVDRVARLIRTLRDGGLSVLLVEQNVALALELSDRAYVIERGTIVSRGPSAELARDPQMISAFLGVDQALRV